MNVGNHGPIDHGKTHAHCGYHQNNKACAAWLISAQFDTIDNAPEEKARRYHHPTLPMLNKTTDNKRQLCARGHARPPRHIKNMITGAAQ
jgi:translation elongation factor EF-Tu-like GTPase